MKKELQRQVLLLTTTKGDGIYSPRIELKNYLFIL